MNSATAPVRPSLNQALQVWKNLLANHSFPAQLLWVFEENLCFEEARLAPGGYRVGIQTRFTPPPEEALDIAYDQFLESGAPLVFYRLGNARGRAVCILLCDPWFETRGESDRLVRRDDWGISFYPGQAEELEEVTDLGRWLHRTKRRRGLHELDFCMTLAMIDEIRTYGRPLVHYERFGQILLNRLRRFLGQAA